jgi:hypothetical protein
MMATKKDIKYYFEKTINYIRKKYDLIDIDVVTKLENNTIKMKVPKSKFNELVKKFENDNVEFEVIPSEKKITMMQPRYNGKNLLKTQPFDVEIFFVEDKSLKKMEELKEKKDIDIKTWDDFFEVIEPEYKNLLKRIIDNITIAIFKNEYNKVISKKNYYLDFKNGMFERKEKLVNDEWKITYQPVTKDIYQVFRMFFKVFDKIPLNELADYDNFKKIVSNTKFKRYLDK